jgi:hypothetical protein
MKRFSFILIGCIFVLSIHSPPLWSGDSWPKPDPSKELVASEFDFFDAEKSYGLAIEKERYKEDFEFDTLLAQAKTEAAGSTDDQSHTNAGKRGPRLPKRSPTRFLTYGSCSLRTTPNGMTAIFLTG